MHGILYITNARIPTEKAHGLQMLKTVEALRKAGARIRLIVAKRRNSITEDPFVFYGIEPSFPVSYLPNTFGPLERIMPNIYFRLQRLSFGIAAFKTATFAPERHILTRDITLAFFLSLFTGKTVAYEDHEPKRSWRFLYRFFLRRIRKKIVVARNLMDAYRLWGVRDGSYLLAPNGVDLAGFAGPKLPRSAWQEFGVPDRYRHVALYVGHFYAWKGVYTLLDAARLLPDVGVVLIGGNTADRAKLNAYIGEKGVANAFIRDFMRHRLVIRYMEIADVLVLPNTASEERSERYTTPLKLFEYMAAGVPIVASKVTSIEGYLDDSSAYFFTPDDSQSLAHALKEALEDDGQRMKAQAALVAVREWTWERRAAKILDFLSQP